MKLRGARRATHGNVMWCLLDPPSPRTLSILSHTMHTSWCRLSCFVNVDVVVVGGGVVVGGVGGGVFVFLPWLFACMVF
jgi:hypothetical protein